MKSTRQTKADLLAESKALSAKITFLESEGEVLRDRAVNAEKARDGWAEKWRTATADRDVLLAMLRSAEGRAQAEVLVRLMTPPAAPDAMAFRWNEAMRRWEDLTEAINRDSDAAIARIEADYKAQQGRIKRTIAKAGAR